MVVSKFQSSEFVVGLAVVGVHNFDDVGLAPSGHDCALLRDDVDDGAVAGAQGDDLGALVVVLTYVLAAYPFGCADVSTWVAALYYNDYSDGANKFDEDADDDADEEEKVEDVEADDDALVAGAAWAGGGDVDDVGAFEYFGLVTLPSFCYLQSSLLSYDLRWYGDHHQMDLLQ